MFNDCKDSHITGINKIEKIVEIAKRLKEVANDAAKETKMIYTPGDSAREFSPLGVTTYGGCNHGCLYC